MDSFQQTVFNLKRYWDERGAIIQEPYDVEVGAGTMCPETFLRVLGPKPYRVASSTEAPNLQRFVEIGLRFYVHAPSGARSYWPQEFVPVRAYFLEADQRPQGKVLIGLDALLDHFATHIEKNNSYLKAREQSPPSP